MSHAPSSLSFCPLSRPLVLLLVLVALVLGTACQSSGERQEPGSQLSPLVLKDLPKCADSAVSGSLSASCSRSALGKERLIQAEPYESNSSLRVYPGVTYGVQLRSVPGGYSGALELKPPADGDYLIYLGTPNINFLVDGAAPSCSLYLSSAVTSRILGAAGEPCAGLIPGVYRVSLQAVERYQLRFGPNTAASWVRLLILPASGAMKAQGVAAGYDHSRAHRSGRPRSRSRPRGRRNAGAGALVFLLHVGSTVKAERGRQPPEEQGLDLRRRPRQPAWVPRTRRCDEPLRASAGGMAGGSAIGLARDVRFSAAPLHVSGLRFARGRELDASRVSRR
jgi:hypothetical protein